ncbi:MAG: hypothetical protein EKK47_11310 [Burkholderiales bacterium]|nr:MAG: hypothetical protein EKK47_11310 [Burkholderiales bacterium]
MDRLPTLLIVGWPTDTDSHLTIKGADRETYAAPNQHIKLGLDSQLRIIFVTTGSLANTARETLPGNSVIDLPNEAYPIQEKRDYFSRAVMAGVLSTANSSGWIILPTYSKICHTETLWAIAEGLNSFGIVHASSNSFTTYPIGFSAEFFSELIRLQHEKDINKILFRYPTLNIDYKIEGHRNATAPSLKTTHGIEHH